MLLRFFAHSSILLGLLIACCLGVSANQTGSTKARRLEILRAHIHDLQTELARSRTEKKALFSALRQIEQAIGQSTYQLAHLDEQLVSKESHLQASEAKYARLQDYRYEQRKILAKQIRSAYIASRQKAFKLVLNQQDIPALRRTLTYLNYLHAFQNQRIHRISETLATITKLQAAIRNQQAQLFQLRTHITHQQARLKAAYQARSKVLMQLDREIQEKDTQLQNLREDEQALERIVSSLHKLLPDIPAETLNIKSFASLRGKLLWPCRGDLIQRFGALRSTGKYHSQGIMIATAQGEPVRAVFYGRIAFADWLRGYGLLLIVDHGDGYMSLYAHNQSLFKEVGDWVDTGEIIAQAGKSGGYQKIGVYFEIRHQGKPTDPLAWLVKPS